MPPNDDELDELIRSSAPRAPRDFSAQVMARAGRTAALRARRRRIALGAGAALAAAVAVLLLMVRDAPRSPAIAGLSTIAPGRVTVGSEAEGSVRAGTLWLTSGRARLQGEARVETEVALVVALGEDADVEIELQRRNDMGKATRALGGVAAAGAAVLSVYVLRGAARVEARPAGSGSPTLLAAGDRAIRMAGAPPLAVRGALGRKDQNDEHVRTHAGTPVVPPLPATVRGTTESDQPKGTLDKDLIRASIQSVIPKVAECYEQALVKHPNLSGRIVMTFKIKNVDGKGKIDEAEMIPSEGEDDLNSPAPSMEYCMLQVMATAEFPAPEGGDVVVRYPFVLKTGETPRSTR